MSLFLDEDKFYFDCGNGIKLYTNFITEGLENWAKKKNLKNMNCFLAIQDNGYKELLLTHKGIPIFASQKSEDIAVHLDMMSLAQNDQLKNPGF